MKRTVVSGIVLTLMLIVVTLTFNVHPAMASGTIYIRADGSIDPPTAPIMRDVDTYTYTDNIFGSIVVERNNIVVDGAKYTLQGVGASVGIDLHGRANVTIRNTHIKNFSYAILLDSSDHSSVIGNNVTDCYGYGIHVFFSDYNSVIGNNVVHSQWGIGLFGYSDHNDVRGNTIASNINGIWLDDCSINSVTGNNITKNWEGIRLFNSYSNNVSGNNIANNDYGIRLDYSTTNRINGNNIVDNDYGMLLYSSSNHNLVSGNTFANNGLTLQDSFPNTVEDNTVNSKPLVYLEGVVDYAVGDVGQVILVNCTGIRVENLNLSRANIAVQLWQTINSRIAGNTLADNDCGILLSSSNCNNVSANNILHNDYGIQLSSSNYNFIDGNSIANNEYAIWFDYSLSNSIQGNTITDNRGGIQFFSSSNYNSISRNTITANVDGIGLDASSSNSMSGNNITGNRASGIYLGGFCNWNSISGNNILFNKWAGIELFGSNNSIIGNNIKANLKGIMVESSGDSIIGNTIAKNWCGIDFYGSSDNRFWHNNLIDNTLQVRFVELGGTHLWDDGYPSGGNYWSDYTARYPSAQELDDSGIWDTPYDLDENNRDNYPLMEPWAPTPPTIMASLDIQPDTFDLRSKGKWITAYIQLPEGHNPADINDSTIMLNGTVEPVLDPKYDFAANSSEYLVDYDNDGVLERMVKFDRASIASWICQSVGMRYEVSLTITGELTDGTPFEGRDIVFVIYVGGGSGRRR